MAVDPFRSEKTIVTVLRISCGGAADASGVPQKPQRRNLSGFSSPQFGQMAINRRCRRYAAGMALGYSSIQCDIGV